MAEENIIATLKTPTSFFPSEKDQIEFFPSVACPKEIFISILTYMDAYTLVQVCAVNKTWFSVAIPLLFNDFNHEMLDIIQNNYFINTVYRDFQNSLPVLSIQAKNDYQDTIFQNYMMVCFNEVVENSETLFLYVTRISQLFIKPNPRDDWDSCYLKEDRVRKIYIESQLKNYVNYVSNLFDKENIKFFIDNYDLEKKTLKKNTKNDANLFVIIQFINAAKNMESFLATLVLYHKDQSTVSFDKSGLPLKNSRWIGGITGSGIVALCATREVFQLIDAVIYGSLGCESYHEFTVQEARLLLSKLRYDDFITALSLIGKECLLKAITAKQPELFALLCSETRASDLLILNILNRFYWSFISTLDVVPELAKRLRNPLFLYRLFVSNLSDAAKSVVANAILMRPTWLADLQQLNIETVFELAKLALPRSHKRLDAFVDDDTIFEQFSLEQICELHALAENPNKAAILLHMNNAMVKITPPVTEEEQASTRLPLIEEISESLGVDVKEMSNQDIVEQKHINNSFSPHYYQPPKKSFDWFLWAMAGLLILAVFGVILGVLALIEVPFSITVCKTLVGIFIHCSAREAICGIFIASAILVVIAAVSTLSCLCLPKFAMQFEDSEYLQSDLKTAWQDEPLITLQEGLDAYTPDSFYYKPFTSGTSLEGSSATALQDDSVLSVSNQAFR